ncbi:hypothetical protein HPB50_008510 [Hyalomma asiaticum]|uniref:Uncharacterized protein n=1 Tax=Hyalomma asiaticum TaxID=266040 RepID=A0ACB7T043_HYAAI|nr:hypothetical protein HPB50_008510 [Hyalomma asiaticum]
MPSRPNTHNPRNRSCQGVVRGGATRVKVSKDHRRRQWMPRSRTERYSRELGEDQRAGAHRWSGGGAGPARNSAYRRRRATPDPRNPRNDDCATLRQVRIPGLL